MRTPAASRTLSVLTALASAPAPARLADVAQAAGLSAMEARRTLERLVATQLACRDAESGYSLGPQALRLAALIAHHHPLEQLARPVLKSLVAETDESATLNVLLPDELLAACVAAEYGSAALQYELPLGERKELFAGASCKPLLAHLSAQQRETLAMRSAPTGVRAPLKRATAQQLEAELESIRRDGYAFSQGERLPGAVGIGAPVFAAGGRVAAVLALTIPEMRFAPARRDLLASSVVSHAARLSHLLGHVHEPLATEETA
ncbi:IclR family transcriptional regulator [Ramlibacter sp.]|uniref:IclR family transcriptional regulator n=1 Tax=Ramlibacter sp. TaxID=1917967 RepID=UPI003D0B14D4